MTHKERRALKRREFLIHSSLAAGALLIGCSDDESDPKPSADMATAPDMQTPAPDMAPDQSDAPDQEPDAPAELASLLSKPPMVQIMGAGVARLRFESTSLEALPVEITRLSGERVTPTLRVDEVSFSWPPQAFVRRVKHPDLAGTYTMQDVTIDGLEPGELVRWAVGDDVVTPRVEGSFRAPPAPGTPVRIGWIADTMMPSCEQVCAMLAPLKPELVLHGGDIQYMTNPLDTWSQALHNFAPLTQQAPLHFCIGNHEYESQDEFNAQYERLIGAHGELGRSLDYHAVSYGSLRFFMMNSEIELAQPDSEQNQWLRAQLEALPQGMIPVVAFHRPYFTFSRSKPNFATRDLLHPMLVELGVPLVLTGHNHGYERFEVDGIQYVVDAGGGAFVYNVNDNRDEVLAERPGDAELRKVASASYGASIIEVDAQNTLTLTRRDLDGAIIDTFTIAAR